jgi:AraC-like DNA-binding protein
MVFTSILLTLLVSFILLINYYRSNKGIIYLVITILGVSLRQLIILLLNTNEGPSILASLYLNFDPLILLNGPAIFFYFKSLIREKLVFDYTLIFHLTPALFILLNTAPYYLVPFNEKVVFVTQLQIQQNALLNPFPYLIIPFHIQHFLIPVVNLFYSIYTIYYVWKIRGSGTIFIKKKLDGIIKHGWFSLLIFLFFSLLLYTYLYALPIFDKVLAKEAMKVFFYFYSLIIPICFFLFPTWLYGGEGSQNVLKRIFLQAKKTSSPNNLGIDYLDFNKSDELESVLIYLEQNQPYLQESFSLHDISKALNIPYTHLTNIFNKQLLISFPTYRNKLRVQFAVSLFREDVHLNMSIDGIAAKSGFKSKTAFYKAFKAEYGINPQEWIKENL